MGSYYILLKKLVVSRTTFFFCIILTNTVNYDILKVIGAVNKRRVKCVGMAACLTNNQWLPYFIKRKVKKHGKFNTY